MKELQKASNEYVLRLGSEWASHVCSVFSHVQLFVTPWFVVHQASLSIEFSRQEY